MYGGKGDGLELLAQAGIAVPEFMTLSADQVSQILSSADAQDRLMHDIQMKLPGATTLAVRSSADIEDGQTDSFAGVFESVLDVPINSAAIIDAIRRVVASASNATSLGHDNVQMNIVIQKFIQPVIAGVCFSHVYDENGQTQCQISYVPGSGDKLVGGRTISYDVRMPWDGDKISTRSMVFSGPGPMEHIQDIYKLIPEIEQICAKIYSFADIEWCMDASGKVWIVQLRPITRNIFLNPHRNADFAVLAAGRARGRAYVIPGGNLKSDEIRDYVSKCPENAILVSFWTDTLFLPALKTARATLVRMGSMMSHSAIIAREQNIPCLQINKTVWDKIENGTEIEVDTYANTLTVGDQVFTTGESGIHNQLGDFYLFDNVYEVFGKTRTNWFQWTDSGLFLHCDIWHGERQAIDDADLMLRRMFGVVPRRTNSKYFDYFQVKRWKMMPDFMEWYDKMRDAVRGFDAGRIRAFYDDTLSAGQELDRRRAKSGELEQIYCTECILGLNAMRDNLFPDYALREIYKYLFPYLHQWHIPFDDFARNDFCHQNKELMRIHQCLMAVAQCRNQAWQIFLDAKVMGADDWPELNARIYHYFGVENTRDNLSRCLARLVCVEYPKLLTGRDEIWDRLWLENVLGPDTQKL